MGQTNRPNRPVAVLLADDHVVVRRGLRLIVESELPGCRVAEAGNALETLAQLQTQRWDLLVLDLGLPDRDGLGLLREIKALWDVKVLVFSVYPERFFAVRAMRAGADGYVSKEGLEEELRTALRAVAAGRRYFSQGLAETLADRISGRRKELSHEGLSAREYEVMLALAAGQTVGHIAKELSISSKTVSTFRRRVLKKMGMRSNADLTRYALGNKLLV